MASKLRRKVFGNFPRDEDKFAGEYIAVVKNEIIAHGKDPEKVFTEARKVGQKPLFTKVPPKGWKEMRILCPKLGSKVKKFELLK
jgi:hypothetical protein